MLFPNYRYIGYKTALDKKTLIYNLLDASTPLPVGAEGYASVYRFSEDVAGLPSLANLPKGTKAYPDYVLFDFDSKDLEKAHKDALTLCDRLKSIEAPFHLFFSGNKGFHVYLPSSCVGIQPTSDVDSIKRFAETLANGLSTFDPSIYNISRIFRVPYSYNLGGKLFKIETYPDTSLTQILEEAKKEYAYSLKSYFPQGDYSEIKILADIYKKITEPAHEHSRVVADHDPKQGGTIFSQAGEGRRNEMAYTVARRLARRGIPMPDAKQIMSNVWNGKACVPPLSDFEIRKVIENAYSKGVNEFIEEDNFAGKVISIEGGILSVAEKFQKQQNGFLTGYSMLDNYTMGFGAEELIWLVGRSGNFKSGVLTNILQRGSKLAKKPALLFSMEMGSETLTPRFIQQAEGMTKKEVITALRAGTPLSSFKKTVEDFEYLKVVYLSNLTTEQVLGLLDHYMETYGPLSAVGFDYLGLFKGVNNNTEKTAKQAQELKTVICKAAQCPVFCLTQAKQIYEGREGDIELDRGCPKDSDSILDLGDYGMGLWGHWSIDSQTGFEYKYQFGKFFKSRGMNTELYGENPYFGLSINKSTLKLDDIVHVPHPDQIGFKQLKGEKEWMDNGTHLEPLICWLEAIKERGRCVLIVPLLSSPPPTRKLKERKNPT